MRFHHIAVFIFIEHYAQRIQPQNRFRRFRYQFFKQLLLVFEMSAAQRVEIVNRRGIALSVRRLNAAFRHRGVRVADTQLGYHHHVCARALRFDRRRSARAAAADNQNVYVVFHLAYIYFFA